MTPQARFVSGAVITGLHAGCRVGAMSLSLLLTLAALLAVAGLADSCVLPSPSGRIPARRSLAGTVLLALAVVTGWGLLMVLLGSAVAAAMILAGFTALLAAVSDAKRRVLGEPLLFSDFALLAALFRHPQFYFSALAPWQRVGLALLLPVLAPLMVWFMLMGSQAMRVYGIAFLLGGWLASRLALRLCLSRGLALEPDADADVRRHGLMATLLLHLVRWRQTRDPQPLPSLPSADFPQDDRLLVVVQCESFADPVALFGDAALELPALAAARRRARQWGDLSVPGFGAYTMRTEYGVIFGRSEAELGFRRFDPYLTALGEASYAVPMRLAPGGWRSLFVHPHDMRFYNRAQILGAGGFDELVGEDRFAAPAAGEGRYVTDAAIADVLVDLARTAEGSTLLYAVTIENHGPWDAGGGDLREGYLRLVRKGDAMLGSLIERLDGLDRPVTLVFFGDHRPSVPGHVLPGGDRQTPYVILDLGKRAQPIAQGDAPVSPVGLVPAELHQALLQAALRTA